MTCCAHGGPCIHRSPQWLRKDRVFCKGAGLLLHSLLGPLSAPITEAEERAGDVTSEDPGGILPLSLAGWMEHVAMLREFPHF